MVVILSVFIVSNNAVFRYMISGIVLLFLSSVATSPPSHLLMSLFLVRDLHEEIGKSIHSICSPWQQSAVNPGKPQALVDGARNRGSCVWSCKHQSQIHGFLGLSPVLFWRRVNPITAGIKLIETQKNNMAERLLEIVISATRKYMVLNKHFG